MKNQKIMWFPELRKNDIPVAGGKGANLGEMTSAGLPVPPGFCITSQVYFDFLRRTGVDKKINKILRETDIEDTERLHRAAKKIKRIIIGSPMPPDIRETIQQAYQELCKKEGEQVYVAVRSSSTAEDLPEASFAGQQETYLDVQGDNELVKAVRKCWSSLFTPRAIFYREKKGFAHQKVGLCAIVQKMVDSEVAGVMFTHHPSGEKEEIIMEAGYGLGESVVGGKVTPDTYTVEKKTLDIKNKKISHQREKITRNPKGLGTRVEKVSSGKREAQKLRDSKIRELARLGKVIEDHYQFPQDIEWGLEDGKLYILQSRPITTLEKGKKETSRAEEHSLQGKVITRGLPASPGIARGKVKLVIDHKDLPQVEKGDVLVTKMTDPNMVPAMSRSVAIVTDEGGTTSHAAIVSREMGVPCVVGTENITKKVRDDDNITVDARKGTVYQGLLEYEKEKIPQEELFSELPPTKTHLYMNLGIPELAEKYKDYPVDGIGLLREEFIIATYIKEHPLRLMEEGKSQVFVDKLAEGISKVAAAFHPRPVILRLSDLKTDEYQDLKGGKNYEMEEANPMLGWRGCSRYYHPKYEKAFLLEVQAIKKVRERHNNVWVMLPFVRTVEELGKVEDIFEEHGIKRGPDFKLWLMAEIPSNALIAEDFAEHCDGFSIGSNDLTQLVLGVDRNSEILGRLGLFDEKNKAVKKAISMIIKGAHAKGKTVSICGQAPSNYPEFTRFLVKEGIDSISVNPDVVAKTKKTIAEAEKRL